MLPRCPTAISSPPSNGSLPTLPPGPPSLAIASDTGLSSSDGVTNDATPTFTGACAAGTTVTVTANDVPIATAVACAAGAYAVTAAPALGVRSNSSPPISVEICAHGGRQRRSNETANASSS